MKRIAVLTGAAMAPGLNASSGPWSRRRSMIMVASAGGARRVRWFIAQRHLPLDWRGARICRAAGTIWERPTAATRSPQGHARRRRSSWMFGRDHRRHPGPEAGCADRDRGGCTCASPFEAGEKGFPWSGPKTIITIRRHGSDLRVRYRPDDRHEALDRLHTTAERHHRGDGCWSSWTDAGFISLHPACPVGRT